MNLQQLEYIVALEEHQHFVRAAEACFVTQPTLSAMIQKLEEELGCLIFDRGKQPVRPTEEGMRIIAQARKVLHEVNSLKEIAHEKGDELKGSLRIAIIPTLAPYLLPLFLKHFTQAHPLVKLHIQELTTEEILVRLERDTLDAGIIATPSKHPGIHESPLFYEAFHVYAGKNAPLPNKQFLLAEDLNLDQLWLLEEGHCLRTQVMRLCELKKQGSSPLGLQYASGSIESLIRMVDAYDGLTILPELAVQNWDSERNKQLHPFASPAPEREISLVTFRKGNKQRLYDALKHSILANLPPSVKLRTSGQVLGI